MKMDHNIVLMTDSYKLSHWMQYPPGTKYVYSYFESRDNAEYFYTVFFGLQAILKKYLIGNVVSQNKINEAEKFAAKHIG